MQQRSLFHLWSLEWKTNTVHLAAGPLELQSDTWHRKQQSAVGSSWRHRMSRGYRDFLSLFRERVESTTQSDQSGILTFTSHSSDQEYRAMDFKALLPLRTCVEKQKSRTPVGQTSMTWSVWADKITVLHPVACYFIWAGLWLKSHSIQSQKYRLASQERPHG